MPGLDLGLFQSQLVTSSITENSFPCKRVSVIGCVRQPLINEYDDDDDGSLSYYSCLSITRRWGHLDEMRRIQQCRSTSE